MLKKEELTNKMNRKPLYSADLPPLTRTVQLQPEGRVRAPFLPIASDMALMNCRHGRKTTLFATNGFKKGDDHRLTKVPIQVSLVETSSVHTIAKTNLLLKKPPDVSKDRAKTTNPTTSATAVKTFGFLRPTQSSLAKCKPVGGKSSSNSSIEAGSQNDMTGAFKRPLPVVPPPARKCGLLKKPSMKSFCRAANSSRQSNANEPNSQYEIVLQVQPKNAFQIFESETSEDTVDLSASAVEKPMSPPDSAKFNIQRILDTPKFPYTGSAEKRTKRKLQFRPIAIRDTSPPPSFDFTINQAAKEPRSVSNAKSYDVFSTPILNLSTVLDLDPNDESVYYTPCAET